MSIRISRSRLAFVLIWLGFVTLAFFWGRGSSLSQATAEPPPSSTGSDRYVQGLAPAYYSDYSKRVVAYIFDTIPITREDLGEYLIARFGAERLQNMVNRRIIEYVAQQKGIEVTAAEVDADFAETLKGLKTTSSDFVKQVLKPYNKNLIEWKEDVVKPRLMMAKLCRERVHVTEEDVQMAFEAYYGEKLDCRIIMWPKKEHHVAVDMYGKIRDNAEEFDRAARTQASTQLAANGGKIEPMGRHTTGNEELEKAAFGLKPGEVSHLLGTPEGDVVIKCVGRTPPRTDKSLSDPKIRQELTKEVYDKKVQQEIPKLFNELQAKANPKLFLGHTITDEELKNQARQELQSDAGKAGSTTHPPARGN